MEKLLFIYLFMRTCKQSYGCQWLQNHIESSICLKMSLLHGQVEQRMPMSFEKAIKVRLVSIRKRWLTHTISTTSRVNCSSLILMDFLFSTMQSTQLHLLRSISEMTMQNFERISFTGAVELLLATPIMKDVQQQKTSYS